MQRQQTRYQVEGMDCAGCAAKIDTAVRRLPGIEEVSVSATAGTMTVRHNSQSDLTKLERAVTGLGYGIAPADRQAGSGLTATQSMTMLRMMITEQNCTVMTTAPRTGHGGNHRRRS